MVFICSGDDTKNRRYFYRGKDCIEKFCKDLKELGMEIINFEEKEIMPLTSKDIESYQKQKVCYICIKKVLIKTRKKIEIIVITPGNLEELLIVNAI